MHQSKKAHITSNKYNTDNKTLTEEMSSASSPVNNTTFSELCGKFGAAMTAAMTSESDHTRINTSICKGLFPLQLQHQLHRVSSLQMVITTGMNISE